MSKDKDNGKALAEQEAIVAAIAEDGVCVEITAAMPLGAMLIAFNQIARKFSRKEMSPQEWAELAIATGLTALKRSWKYSDDLHNLKDYAQEMKDIKKLFTVPDPTHAEYAKRRLARAEAEDNCAAKYGQQ